jgi:hypothetical protein
MRQHVKFVALERRSVTTRSQDAHIVKVLVLLVMNHVMKASPPSQITKQYWTGLIV